MSTHTEPLSEWRGLLRTAGLAAYAQLIITLISIVVMTALGPPPAEIEPFLAVFQESPIAGLLRDDFLFLLLVAVYLVTFSGIYYAMRREYPALTTLAVLFTFAAATLSMAAHSGFSLWHLSEQYAQAATEAQKQQILAAAEAVRAMGWWNSTAGFMTGLLLQGSGVMISAGMLKHPGFARLTAFSGLIANGLDLVQHILHFPFPAVAAPLLYVAGPLYLVWYFMLGRDLWRLGRPVSNYANSD